MPFASNLKRVTVRHEPLPATNSNSPQDKPDAEKLPIGPACPRCGGAVTWYQSRLQQNNGSQKIVHSFQCTNCGTLVETEEPKKHALRVV